MTKSAKIRWFALLATASLLSGSCSDGSPAGPAREITELPRELSLSEELLISAGNDFAFRFLDQIFRASPDSNLFLAPLSASMALGMTINGAAGSTFDEMRDVLGLGTMDQGEINEGYMDLTTLLLGLDPTVELGIGNSIWYRSGFSVRADFLERTQAFFGAQATEMNFSASSAVEIINAWVREATRGRIKEIVEPPIHPATVMFLINAVYFKGSWTHRFPKSKTSEAPFTGEDGQVSPVSLMELVDTFPYAETQSYQALDLPYGGGAFSMTLLLPKEGLPIEDLVSSLNPERWTQIVQSLADMEGTVHLPRFRMEWGRELKEDLEAMGMQVPFGPEADFSRLADQGGLYISEVIHKTFVDVDEEGTEAAGVTSVEIRETSIPEHFFFRADRPFLFVIRERISQTILFAGILVEAPQA